ncbi:MAG: enoyl-CoA hydratase/isomerase family protein [Boseongicola sp.]|nr:enoyl-CoA hydratase/isomerase family protein [Silicimonas sp.]NNF92864.1 enoyl-CoA hydratase/isomerase family protein [Boseongicola sp.]
MIGVSVRDGRMIVTLDRQEKANALTSGMLGDLVKRVEEARVDSDVTALVLTGAGKTFSAGADLDEVRDGDLAVSPLWERLSGAIAGCPCLTIAALNGSLAGGAMGMALACDIRLSVPSARFFYPAMKLGVLPQPSDPGRLTALVGPARAKLILLGAARLDAETALRFGLVDGIHDDPLAAAIELSEAACGAGRTHLVAMKSMFA